MPLISGAEVENICSESRDGIKLLTRLSHINVQSADTTCPKFKKHRTAGPSYQIACNKLKLFFWARCEIVVSQDNPITTTSVSKNKAHTHSKKTFDQES